ncbi:hypothetical protein BaRGS_00018910 [Batillaria attramentaria]|uniref:Uncharacterized protein n=1 Tax=Batillaria attramentaria TaxID=370345 RepID=A0ABD0KSN4_9CAEN
MKQFTLYLLSSRTRPNSLQLTSRKQSLVKYPSKHRHGTDPPISCYQGKRVNKRRSKQVQLLGHIADDATKVKEQEILLRIVSVLCYKCM